MLRKGSVVILAMLLLLACSGCFGPKTKGGQSAQENITVAGSTSVQPLAEELAQAFSKKNPGKKVYVQGGGSSAGIQGVKTGAADIGTSSRELKSTEKGPKEYIIARDAIAVIVNPANTVGKLTMDQVRKIFTGEITNWQQVGGANAPIRAFTREEGSGTRGAFQEIVMKESKFANNLLVQNSTGAIKQGVISDKNAVGYISLGAVDQKVKAVSVDGIVPSKATAQNGTYKIVRPFLFLSQEKPKKKLTSEFISYVLSPEGQKIVAKEFIPVEK